MSEIGSRAHPLRVAIIGSGPSGFYAAEALFKSGKTIRIDMYDRLPTPFGLVRGGVAPDHLKIKTVTRVFDKIAACEGFSFLGNVAVGRDVTVDELRAHYHAVLFACGAETDRKLGVPGENLPGSHTATEFVAWYNGHPDYRDRVFDLSHEIAVIVGQGNVAIDVSRILSKTADELRQTDIAQHALDVLAASNLREIHLIGRRGPVQAKCTSPELKEFGHLGDCDPVIDPADLALNAACETELHDKDNQHAQKNMAILREFAERPASSKRKRFVIRFLLSPVELYGAARLEGVRLERTRLEGPPFHQQAVGTGVHIDQPCGILFCSVGYRGVPIPGVPFDERHGRIPNRHGRIYDCDHRVPQLYAVGWIKRGPSGIIGSNKPDSVETAQAILDDLHALPTPAHGEDAIRELLAARSVRVVSFAEWKKIDAVEIERGTLRGKPREKFTSVAEMLAVLDGVS
ncbi:MAG TPA: FAD-dependent oxidoreductase [Candidatus Hydrogenedentes bacterium]|nr:FAD-dependent oxidoreductase [Candidatus Hydrogenedentota bacterium]HOS01843.1 FAD-dependent oxidoreductase [Candidatus Hydrogenedentota bacterium]